jgi:hypothetical protein
MRNKRAVESLGGIRRPASRLEWVGRRATCQSPPSRDPSIPSCLTPGPEAHTDACTWNYEGAHGTASDTIEAMKRLRGMVPTLLEAREPLLVRGDFMSGATIKPGVSLFVHGAVTADGALLFKGWLSGFMDNDDGCSSPVRSAHDLTSCWANSLSQRVPSSASVAARWR